MVMAPTWILMVTGWRAVDLLLPSRRKNRIEKSQRRGLSLYRNKRLTQQGCLLCPLGKDSTFCMFLNR